MGKSDETSVTGPKVPSPRLKCGWVMISTRELFKLAHFQRSATLAVLAELYRLHFESWDKSQPVKFGNRALKELGFSHHDKNRALEDLETLGWVSVQRNGRKAPTVKILKGFRFTTR